MTAGSVYRTTAQVGPGHRIEIVAPELAEGDRVEILVLSSSPLPEKNAFATIESLNLPMRDAAYWEERERELRESRESWDR